MRAVGATAFLAVAAGAALVALLASAEEAPAPPEESHAEIAPLADESLLLDGVAVDGRLIVVGERGHVLVSSDAGATWQQAKVPTRATLTGVWFENAELGWAVGHDEVILKTVDGGLTWQQVHAAPENLWPLLDVWFRDARQGLAVGAYSKYLTTDDAGETWREVTFEPAEPKIETSAEETAGEEDETAWYAEDDLGYDVHLNEIVPAFSYLYLPAEAGQIFRSDDNGATWVTLPSPYEGSFYGALPLDDDSLLIFGLRGHLFRSDDAGLTWTQLETGTESMLTDGLVTPDGAIVIVGLAGTVIVSRDGGRTFVLDQQEDRKGFARILPAASGYLLLGEGGMHAYQLPAASLASATDGRRELK